MIEKIKPDEIYNLAAQSHVGTSFLIPEYTADVVALGTLRILEIIKNKNKKIRFYQASSSEMFGDTKKFHKMKILYLNQCLHIQFLKFLHTILQKLSRSLWNICK